MNLTIERGPALSALSRVVGVVERRGVIPILSNVALSTADGRLSMRATDLEMEAIESVSAQISGEGEIGIPADKFHDIVRNADPLADIALSTGDEDPRVRVSSGRSNFRLPAMSVDDFPKFRSETMGAPFAMPAAVLANMLNRVSWAFDPTDKISAKGCVFLAAIGDELHTVATNGKVVALRSIEKPAGAEIAALLPGKLALHIAKWLSGVEGDVEISTSESLIRISNGSSTLTSKLDGAPKYFDYQRFLLRTGKLSAVTDQDALSMALRRVLGVLDDKVKTVRLSFSEGSIAITTRGQSDGADEIACDYEGPEASVMIKGADLQNALASLTGDRVRLGFSNGSDPVVIDAPSDAGFVSNAGQMRA